VTLALHGLDHAQSGQWVDETRSAFSRGGARRQQQALFGLDAALREGDPVE
jgi:hypothetical protein